jgi:hypothetical protein
MQFLEENIAGFPIFESHFIKVIKEFSFEKFYLCGLALSMDIYLLNGLTDQLVVPVIIF